MTASELASGATARNVRFYGPFLSARLFVESAAVHHHRCCVAAAFALDVRAKWELSAHLARRLVAGKVYIIVHCFRIRVVRFVLRLGLRIRQDEYRCTYTILLSHGKRNVSRVKRTLLRGVCTKTSEDPTTRFFFFFSKIINEKSEQKKLISGNSNFKLLRSRKRAERPSIQFSRDRVPRKSSLYLGPRVTI